MKVSFIIPVYNVENYLPRCIESVLNQDNTELEILLINDGSTDSSGLICDKYAKNDDRIRVFNQDNNGVSSARNKGIDNATGEWVCFVDADDWIVSNSLEKIQNLFDDKDTDYVILRSHININGQAKTERYPFSNNLLNKKHNGIDLIIQNVYLRGSVCGVIYNRMFLLRNKIKFPLYIKNGEDSIFQTLCSIYATRISFADINFYNVFERNESASRGNWSFDRVLSMTNNIKYLNTYIEEHKNLNIRSLNILDFAKYGVLSNMYNNFSESFSIKKYLVLRKEVKNLLMVKIKTGPIKTNKRKVKLLNISLDAFALIILLKNKLIK